MKIGKVIGNLWATRKSENLSGEKFLIVKILEQEEIFKDELFVACDRIGAGNGDLVLLTEGSSARKIGNDNLPIDCAVIGIIDSMEF
ncbi:MAG: EutN/CcmL family microcompartment protein [Eubacteriales bacterium]|nr:EutN/CcmL family microcompartment protein [Eubacteriales bacterium]